MVAVSECGFVDAGLRCAPHGPPGSAGASPHRAPGREEGMRIERTRRRRKKSRAPLTRTPHSPTVVSTNSASLARFTAFSQHFRRAGLCPTNTTNRKGGDRSLKTKSREQYTRPASQFMVRTHPRLRRVPPIAVDDCETNGWPPVVAKRTASLGSDTEGTEGEAQRAQREVGR